MLKSSSLPTDNLTKFLTVLGLAMIGTGGYLLISVYIDTDIYEKIISGIALAFGGFGIFAIGVHHWKKLQRKLNTIMDLELKKQKLENTKLECEIAQLKRETK
jgi:hypothetical protein